MQFRTITTPVKGEDHVLMHQSSPSLSLDMLRAFVCLADCLNLSEASRQLAITRQTLRRHIDQLEYLRGTKLFELRQRQYTLSATGETLLSEARDILDRCAAWSGHGRLSVRNVDGLEHASLLTADGFAFHSQQHTPASISDHGVPLLKHMLCAWGQATASLDHPELDRLRPYLIIFRRTQAGWVFADVGKQSAYARWFGVAQARSAMGMALQEDGVGDEFNAFIARAYVDIHDTGGIRVDHLQTYLRHPNSTRPLPVQYQRLLAGCQLPNGRRALAMMAAITDRVVIDAIRKQPGLGMSKDLHMEDEPEFASVSAI